MLRCLGFFVPGDEGSDETQSLLVCECKRIFALGSHNHVSAKLVHGRCSGVLSLNSLVGIYLREDVSFVSTFSVSSENRSSGGPVR